MVLLALSLLATSAGCKKAAEKIAEKAAEKMVESESGGKADVDISEGKIKITSKEGGEEKSVEFSGGEGAALPADYPAGIPAYPDAKLVGMLKTDQKNFQAHYETGDKADDVYGFFLKKFSGDGWQLVQEVKMPPSFTLMGKKGQQTVNVIISGEEAKSNFMVHVSLGKV